MISFSLKKNRDFVGLPLKLKLKEENFVSASIKEHAELLIPKANSTLVKNLFTVV